ncbi:MAG: ATP synthase F0 subunit B [Desulfuromonadales bacterium]|nr:ATP synthase F0 subunit B [Desulfuromonadales bacterium]
MKRCIKIALKPQVLTVIFMVLILLTATLAFAEGDEEHVSMAVQLKDLMWRCIAFAMLVIIFVWGIKKLDVKKALSERRENIAKSLQEAEEMKVAAEQKIAEYDQKLADANKEVEELRAAMREEGLAEKARIIAEAASSAEKIKAQAVKAAEQEIIKAKAELRYEASRLAVQLAEKTLKEVIGADDQGKLVDEYLSKVVELH